MDSVDSSWPGRRRLPRWLVAGLSAGLPILGTGCGGAQVASLSSLPPAMVRSEPKPPPAQTTIQQVQHVVAAHPTPDVPREVPITLDAVFHLAEQQNPRIGLARERLNESLLTQSQKSRLWLPNVYAGVGYYRHEGGIQDQDGRLIHSSTGALSPGLTMQAEIDLREATFQEIDSQRKVWQQKVSLSQVNSEILLEAALTYIDLLTARRGEIILRDLESYEKKLLDKAEKLARNELGAKGLVEGIKATLSNRYQLLSQLRQQGNAASAKLVYLLGLPPQTCLLPIDPVIAPFELVDVSAGRDGLIGQALAQGPGIRELQGILGIIQLGLDKSTSIHNLLPSFQVNAYEGAFGAGPGGSMQWDNRLDVAVQMRWNLTQICQSEFQRTVGRSKQAQALLNYDDLRGKLAAGVLEASEAIFSGREQIGLATSQVQHANENYRLANQRLDADLQSGSPSDVLLSIRALEQAHFNLLSAISTHNKAQIRLLLLLGIPCPKPVGPPPPPTSKPLPAQRQLLPQPTTASSPVPGGPDGSIIKIHTR